MGKKGEERNLQQTKMVYITTKNKQKQLENVKKKAKK